MLHKLFFFALIFTLTLNSNSFAQTYQFAWIGEMGLGSPNVETGLDSAVQFINSRQEIKFVILTGSISANSKTTELEKAKSILDKLQVPYYAIPGNNDTKWNCSRINFIDVFGDDKFIFQSNDEIFIGLSSAIHWRGDTGHFKPEDLYWLEDQLREVYKDQKIYFISSDKLESTIDNWFKATNLLRNKNIQAVFCGNGNENQLYNFNQIPGFTNRSLINRNNEWDLNLIESTTDSLLFYEMSKDVINKWSAISKHVEREIPFIDSTQFSNLSTEVIWNNEINASLIAAPVVWENKIYTADNLGLITCFDSTGNVIWDYDAFGEIVGKPALADEILVAATLQGDLVTLDAETGQQIQTIGFDEQITSNLTIIEYIGSKELLLPKFTDSKSAVLIGTNTGKLYCYDLETLQEYWVYSIPTGRIESEPVLIDNKLIYGNWDGYLYCIDARSGWLIWRWSDTKDFHFSPAANTPVTNGKQVFITTPNGYLYSIDLQLGRTVWKSNKCNAWESFTITDDKKYLIVRSTSDKVYLISADKGKIIKEINLGFGKDKFPSSPVSWVDKIIFGASNGSVYMMNKNYSFEKLLFMGTSPVNSIQKFMENKFIASNIDGRIIMFKID